jgi:hypothetical protein
MGLVIMLGDEFQDEESEWSDDEEDFDDEDEF